MTQIIASDFSLDAMRPGDSRSLVLEGDCPPFKVTIRCFVDSPPPAGFRPCAACRSHLIFAGKPLQIDVDPKFWSKESGKIVIDIQDSKKNEKQLIIEIIPDTDQSSHTLVAR